MAESSLSFHCIVCYETFEHEQNYPVVLPCGHTFICNECSGRINKCMECRASLLYPLELDPAYRDAVAAAKVEEAQERRLHRGAKQNLPMKPKPIHIKPESRMRLPCPKNLVLLSLMEATVANNQSVDDGAAHGAIKESDSNREILEGVNIVTGGCGTYAVTRKEGLWVYSDKQDIHQHHGEGELAIALTESTDLGTEVTPGRGKAERKSHPPASSPVAIRKSKSVEIKTPVKQEVFVHHRDNHHTQTNHATSPSPSLEQMFCTNEPREKSSLTTETMFKLHFGDHVQVVEFDVDGWAKLARGKGYIYAEHGSELVKVGGPKDKACFVEGMMYSLLHRYMSLQNDQDDLHRMLEVLRKDLDAALWGEKDYTIIPSEMLTSVADESSSIEEEDGSDVGMNVEPPAQVPELPNLDEEKDEAEDLRYPVKPPKVKEDGPGPGPGLRIKSSAEAGTFSLENIPLVGRFVCGNNRHQSISSIGPCNSNVSDTPPSPHKAMVMEAYTGVNFRTGLSGHKGLSTYQSPSTGERNKAPRPTTTSSHLMSVTNGISQTKRRKNQTDARAMWEKEFMEAAKFSQFPGVARRSVAGKSGGGAPKLTMPKGLAAGLSILVPSSKENRPLRKPSPRAENTVVRVAVSRAPGTGGTPKMTSSSPQLVGKGLPKTANEP